MTQLRQNLATKEWVIIATERARRPDDFIHSGHGPAHDVPELDAHCPFCPGNEEDELEALRLPETGPWEVRIVRNLYPAVAPEGMLVRDFAGVAREMSGIGYHEILVESRLHNETLALMTPAAVTSVFRALVERGREIAQDRRIEMIVIFKNHGHSAGASLLHPHTQIVALPIVPNDVRVRADEARRYYDQQGQCVFCDVLGHELASQTRIVCETDHFVALVPYAAAGPFNTWIMPRRHTASFFGITEVELEDLGGIVQTMLRKLYEGLYNPDYNFVVRTAPTRDGGVDYLHWYITLVPRLAQAAGFELGSGIFINVTLPEACAEFLRKTGVVDGL
jgi:UDPglucose--hexose-1-phosphate uridylyltransferase